ncbi:hypothetical protein FACS1894208_05370 [Clostridia bacterium]|nr:hypothetical protein FACS1894208_05370 [Clostridia bacterium]
MASNTGTGGNNVPLVMAGDVAAFMGGQGADAGSIAYSETVSPSLRSQAGGNTVPMVMTKQAPRHSGDVRQFHADERGRELHLDGAGLQRPADRLLSD